MMPRNILLPTAFAAAIGIPLIALRTDTDGTSSNVPPGATARSGSANAEVELFGPSNDVLYPPIQGLDEILRFDVYPDWVKSRWPRVSTAPSADGLQGMRVALVTGPNRWDICGSLTYYFDDNKRAQRIALVGETGDASRLAKFLVDRYQFQVHQTPDAGLLTASTRRRMYGMLKLENATVILASDPNHQVRVVLELNNPEGDLVLSESMAQVARANGR